MATCRSPPTALAMEQAAIRMQEGTPLPSAWCCLGARRQVVHQATACLVQLNCGGQAKLHHHRRCFPTGGHNVIVGLLDFLLERHPGSSLLAFKNGPRGILASDFTEITEDFMVRQHVPACASKPFARVH